MNALREALLRGRRRPRLAGAGSPTLYRGDGYEFFELREYAPGDDVRRIDWAATARSGMLQTRIVLEDVALTLAAIVDTSPSMRAGRARPLSDSAQEALEFWRGAAEGSDRSLRVYADGAFPNDRNEASFDLAATFDAAAAVLPRGTALLVISDFWDLPDNDDAIAYLGNRFDCTALVARDPWYDGLPLRGFVRIADAESGASANVFVGRRQRKRYAAAVRDRETGLTERLASRNWRTGIFDAETDGGHALLEAFGVR